MPVIEVRYAEALYGAGSACEVADKIQESLMDFLTVLSGPHNLREFLLSPVVSREIKKDTALKVLTKDTHPLVQNFVMLLIDKGRLELMPVICEEYKRIKDKRQNKLNIEVYSAQPLENAMLAEIAEKYRKRYDAADAEAHQHIDPSLIGGIRIQIGDIRIEDTLSGRLNGLLSAWN